mmetsp:Transcript_14569/g.26212  ORF Transcript_14569/g.26212 Transcript_14569/m.26212 type:complete len:108 (+) Transcript_14569:254-577(+)
MGNTSVLKRREVAEKIPEAPRALAAVAVDATVTEAEAGAGAGADLMTGRKGVMIETMTAMRKAVTMTRIAKMKGTKMKGTARSEMTTEMVAMKTVAMTRMLEGMIEA